MKRPGPHFEIVRLVKDAASVRPVPIEGENQVLEGHRSYPNMDGVTGSMDGRNAAKLSRNLKDCQEALNGRVPRHDDESFASPRA